VGANEAGVELRQVGPRGAGIEVSEEWVALGAGMACVGAEVEVTHGRIPPPYCLKQNCGKGRLNNFALMQARQRPCNLMFQYDDR